MGARVERESLKRAITQPVRVLERGHPHLLDGSPYPLQQEPP